MCDDLANDWGCDLIFMGRSSGRKRKVGAMIAILADDRRQRNFHSLIEKTTNNMFGLMKLTTNGSDANLYAVTSQTQGNTSGCLIACGSYVSGDIPCKVGLQVPLRLVVGHPASYLLKIEG